MRGGSGARSTWTTLSKSTFAGDDVVGHVEIGGAGTAVDRVARRHLDIIGDTIDAIDRVREFAERRGDQYLALFLKGTHGAAIGFGGAADQDHRPAILLGVGKTGKTVNDAGAGHDDAGAGAAGQIAIGLRGVRGGLLVAHADIGDTFLLCRCRDRADGKSDNPEQVVDTLLFEASGDQGGAVDLSHVSLPCVGGRRPMRETPPGPVIQEVCRIEITHLWRCGERLIRSAHDGRGGFACRAAPDLGHPRPTFRYIAARGRPHALPVNDTPASARALFVRYVSERSRPERRLTQLRRRSNHRGFRRGVPPWLKSPASMV